MRAELQVPFAAIVGFVLVLSRILGVFVFLPLPGKEAGPSMARIVLAFAMALAVFPQFPGTGIIDPTPGLICFWLASELALGLTVGLLISFLAEFLTVGAHVLALQAGYAYASVIDPTTQADSEVLQVFAQLIGGFLFFTTGLDHLAIRTFSMSLHSFPPGQFLLTKDLAMTVVALSASIFSIGLKLALPVVALLLMTEIALALVARLSAQLQLGFNASAIKMMLTLLVLASILQVIPRLYEGYAAEIAHALIGRFQGSTPH
jgi:flagellar biosynthesis protein FliR